MMIRTIAGEVFAIPLDMEREKAASLIANGEAGEFHGVRLPRPVKCKSKVFSDVFHGSVSVDYAPPWLLKHFLRLGGKTEFYPNRAKHLPSGEHGRRIVYRFPSNEPDDFLCELA